MLQIKTIYRQYTHDFDKEVNLALEDGWTLTRRAFDEKGFLAELEKEVITEDEKTCENCKHYDTLANNEPCISCTDDADKWEAME